MCFFITNTNYLVINLTELFISLSSFKINKVILNKETSEITRSVNLFEWKTLTTAVGEN